MNPQLLAHIAWLATLGGIVAAFFDKISWGDVGLIFIVGFALNILNGAVIGRRLRKLDELNRGD